MIFPGFMCHHQWKKVWEGYNRNNLDSFNMHKEIFYKCIKCAKTKIVKGI